LFKLTGLRSQIDRSRPKIAKQAKSVASCLLYPVGPTSISCHTLIQILRCPCLEVVRINQLHEASGESDAVRNGCVHLPRLPAEPDLRAIRVSPLQHQGLVNPQRLGCTTSFILCFRECRPITVSGSDSTSHPIS